MGRNGPYPHFEIEFEHAAPKPTTAELLAASDPGPDETKPEHGDEDVAA